MPLCLVSQSGRGLRARYFVVLISQKNDLLIFDGAFKVCGDAASCTQKEPFLLKNLYSPKEQVSVNIIP